MERTYLARQRAVAPAPAPATPADADRRAPARVGAVPVRPQSTVDPFATSTRIQKTSAPGAILGAGGAGSPVASRIQRAAIVFRGAVVDQPVARIRPNDVRIIRRETDDELDDGVDPGNVDLEDVPGPRPKGRDDGPRWRSRRTERERTRNWNRRGAERSAGKAKRERGQARDRKHGVGRDDAGEYADEQDLFDTPEAKAAEQRLADERQRKAGEARQERERQEAEERQRQEAERKRVEAEAEQQRQDAERELREEEDSLKNWSSAVPSDPALFKRRADRHIDRLKAHAAGVLEKEQQFVQGWIAEAKTAVAKASGDRTQRDAIALLTRLATRIASASVDKLAPLRTAATTKVGAAVSAATLFRNAHPQAGPARDLAESLLRDANQIATDAQDSSTMNRESSIDEIARRADGLVHAITAAQADVVHFPLFTGDHGERLAQLRLVRQAGVSVIDMTNLMPLIPATGGTARAGQLVNLYKVAAVPGAIGLVGLPAVLAAPGVVVDHLVHAIVLTNVIQQGVPFIVANCTQLQTIASEFPTTRLDWFTGMSWVQITGLVNACSAPQVATFSTKVTGAKILGYLNGPPNRCLTPVQIAQYIDRPVILANFQGGFGGAWYHVTKDTHFDPQQLTISGGHDEAGFDAIFTNPPDGVTLTRHLDPPGQAATNTIKKYSYTVTRGTKTKSGSKTVVTGLRANEAAFLVTADNALWDAFRRGRFFDNADWQGQTGNGNNRQRWKGKHDDGVVRSGWPEL